MAHSDGIRVVRYRSFEEICFNLRTYHHHEPTESDELRNIRRLAGTEEAILFAGESSDHPSLPHYLDCGLPVFQAVNRPGCAVCAHLCEID